MKTTSKGTLEAVKDFFCWFVFALLLPFIMLAAMLTGALLCVVMTAATYLWLIAEAARWLWRSAQKLLFGKAALTTERVDGPARSTPSRSTGLPGDSLSADEVDAIAYQREQRPRKWLQ